MPQTVPRCLERSDPPCGAAIKLFNVRRTRAENLIQCLQALKFATSGFTWTLYSKSEPCTFFTCISMLRPLEKYRHYTQAKMIYPTSLEGFSAMLSSIAIFLAVVNDCQVTDCPPIVDLVLECLVHVHSQSMVLSTFEFYWASFVGSKPYPVRCVAFARHVDQRHAQTPQ